MFGDVDIEEIQYPTIKQTPKRRISHEIIMILHRDGHSGSFIAELLGCSDSYVSKVIKKYEE